MGSVKLSIPKAELNKALSEIERAKTKYEKNVANELFRGALNIESGAKRNIASHDFKTFTGNLRASIQSKIDKQNISADVVVNAHYGAYVEFGTGRYAASYLSKREPEEIAEASKFKGRGIKEHNMPQRPYFFPAYYAERPKIVERIKRVKI